MEPASLKEQLLRDHPGIHYLDAGDAEGIARYLARRGWIGPEEQVLRAEKAGEGNMNCTLRVTTSRRSLILKQARPWVEKYRHIPAPWNRALVEGRFYQALSGSPSLSARMPRLLGMDPDSRILALEDLGEAQDFTFLYSGGTLSDGELRDLAAWLSALHRFEPGPESRGRFANREMRDLNHRHIFDIPLRGDNGLDLDRITPGLEKASDTLRRDGAYCDRVEALGSLYLAEGPVLLHGDYFPGSWLRTGDGVRIIDPEFCFCGPAEFDVGVMIAHLHLAGQGDERVAGLLGSYEAPGDFDLDLALGFAGVEIMRRLIGVAQLPLRAGIAAKRDLLDLSRSFVLRNSGGAS